MEKNTSADSNEKNVRVSNINTKMNFRTKALNNQIDKEKLVMRRNWLVGEMWRKWNPHTMLVGM